MIANPAPFHVPTARQLCRLGTHLLVEKPLSDDLQGVTDLIEACEARSLVLMVGYNFRYSASLQIMHETLQQGRIGAPRIIKAEVGQYLPDWRPAADYRSSVTARKALGGGALLELSHEIDLVCWLMCPPLSVRALTAQVSDLDIDVKDTVEIILRFPQNRVGYIHLDMVRRSPRRRCEIVGSSGTLVWNGLNEETRLYPPGSDDPVVLSSPVEDRNIMYLNELQHFLQCVAGEDVPRATGRDGQRVLEIVRAVRLSSESGKEVFL